MMILAHEHDPDPSLRPTIPAAPEKRDDLIQTMIASLTTICRHFAPQRAGETPIDSGLAIPQRRVGPKVAATTGARVAAEGFALNIRNPNTRKAYARAVAGFAGWCNVRGIVDVRQVQPVHVAAYIEGLTVAAPSVKQRLAALRMLLDWLVVGQVMPTNTASSVRGLLVTR